jgi:hypothetical protein
MVVYTGASSSVRYGYETAGSYGTTASSLTNTFGINSKVTGLSLSNTRINLNKLGQVEPTKFAYGQQAGSVSVGFVFDDSHSHKIFQSIYGSPSGTAPFLYPATLAQGGTSPTTTSLTTQIELQTGANAKLTRILNGCVVNTLNISTSIGEPMNGSVDMTFGKESTAAVGASGTITQQSAVSLDQGGVPYTFAHGELKVSNGSSLVTVAEVQEADVSFAQNTELLYGLNSNSAIDAYRKVLDVTGRFKTAWKDSALIQYVIDQVRTGKELLDASGVGIELTFTGGTTGANTGKSIKIELDDISFADHGVSGLEPVEPVFEEINWQAKTARVSVDTTA